MDGGGQKEEGRMLPMTLKEQFLYNAMDVFKQLIVNGECSKQDINYFCDFSKRELDNRGASVGEKKWITKEEASQMLGISTSTFDRYVLKGGLPRGKKLMGQKSLVWKREQVEQLRKLMLLKGNH